MVMKVFGPPKSTNVARVLICLEEVGADYEIVPLDFATAEHKSRAHAARNPFGQIPAFQDDDFVIFESRAISRYVLKKYKSDLLPEDDLKKATLVDVWPNVEYGIYNVPISTIIYDVIFKQMMGSTSDQKIVDENLEKIWRGLRRFWKCTRHACHRATTWLEIFSVWLIDLSHFPYTYYFMGTQFGSLFDSYPHVKAWWETIMSRPSIRKVVELMSD